jgi:solute carrier family 34 (sodium-dependent phosphate cotransporter)
MKIILRLFLLFLSCNIYAAERQPPIPYEQGQRVLEALRRETPETEDLREVDEEIGEQELQEEDRWLEENKYTPSPEERAAFIRYFSCKQVDSDSNTCARNSLYYLSGVNWKKVAVSASLPITLWFFLLNLKLLGSGFKLLGGKDSAKMFDVISNPFSALMIGILATVLVQSSSTSTSIIISLVGAGELSVENAIPMIMGANIGTTVTNTIVAHGHIKDPTEFSHAFASATVHDLFNFLSVLIFFPLQWGTNFLGELTWQMAKDHSACDASVDDCSKWKGDPVSLLVSPTVKKIVSLNKKVIKAIALKECNNSTICEEDILKAGFLHDSGLSDEEAGVACTVVPIVGISICLYTLVKSLKYLIKGKAARMLKKSLDYNAYLSMLIGCAITIAVQSSSITTSTLTPLCASGLISLEQVYPLTLGANIGTCVTGILAALVATSHPVEAMQVALAHLSFNILGIVAWYPIPYLRNIPIKGAKYLGEITKDKRWFPLVYTASVFVALPGICYAITHAAE